MSIYNPFPAHGKPDPLDVGCFTCFFILPPVVAVIMIITGAIKALVGG